MAMLDVELAKRCITVQNLIRECFRQNDVATVIGWHAICQIVAHGLAFFNDQELDEFFVTLRKQVELFRENRK